MQKDDAVGVQERIQKQSDDLEKFDKIMIEYYSKIETSPTEVIKQTENLITKVKTEQDSNNVRWNKLSCLFDLRAETFYKMGGYQNSIREIYKKGKSNQEALGGRFSLGHQDCIHLACNFVKLKDFQKARIFLDSVAKGWYIVDYVISNYYEVIGNKDKALQSYYDIKKQESRDHYYYYKDALKRIEELNKPNPKLLNELYYPSDRPDNEICKTDNERRTKIFDLIDNLPEVKNCKSCDGVSVYKEPKETKSSKYWIRVGHYDGTELVSQFNFSVDTLTYEIRYLDTKTDKELALNEWRKQK